MIEARDALLAADMLAAAIRRRDQPGGALGRVRCDAASATAPPPTTRRTSASRRRHRRSRADPELHLAASQRRGHVHVQPDVGRQRRSRARAVRRRLRGQRDPGRRHRPGDRARRQVAAAAGTYSFVARADGFGAQKFAQTIAAGQRARPERARCRPTRPRTSNGAVTTTRSDGVNRGSLIDDTEETELGGDRPDPGRRRRSRDRRPRRGRAARRASQRQRAASRSRRRRRPGRSGQPEPVHGAAPVRASGLYRRDRGAATSRASSRASSRALPTRSPATSRARWRRT